MPLGPVEAQGGDESSEAPAGPSTEPNVVGPSTVRRGERIRAFLTAFERLTGTRVRIAVDGEGGRRVLFDGRVR
ncbi:MAG: hypothetical protein P8049_08485, partial [Gemmatimonadota bacterium]